MELRHPKLASPRPAAPPAVNGPVARSQVSARTVWTVGMHVLLMAAALVVLRGASDVIQWILIALFLALSLDPAVRFLQARRLSRPVAVAITMGGLLAMIALLAATLIPMLFEQGRSLVESAPRLLERLRASETIAALDSRLHVIASLQRGLSGRVGSAAGPVVHVVGGLLKTAAAAVTIAVLTSFMLLFGGQLFRSLLGWLPPQQQPRAQDLAGRMHKAVGGYVSGTLLVALIGGVFTTLLLLALGVPYFLPLGLAMALLGVVPFLGAALGGILVVATTFLSSGMKTGLIALALFLLYQQLENHLLQPLIQRHTIRMNPLAIALVMLIGTAVAGVLGALLSLPLAAAGHILLQDVVNRGDRRNTTA
jgi:predicted PurR-regulated permease PerM